MQIVLCVLRDMNGKCQRSQDSQSVLKFGYQRNQVYQPESEWTQIRLL